MAVSDEHPFCPSCGFQMKVGKMSRCPQCGKRLQGSGETDVPPGALHQPPTHAAVHAGPSASNASVAPGSTLSRPEGTPAVRPAAHPDAQRRFDWQIIGAGVGAWLAAMIGASWGASHASGDPVETTAIWAGLGGIAGPVLGAAVGLMSKMRSLYAGGEDADYGLALRLGAATGGVIGPGVWAALAAQRPDAVINEWVIIGGAVVAGLCGSLLGVGAGTVAWKMTATQ